MSVSSTLATALRDTYARTAKLAEDLGEDAFHRGDRTSPSIAFHVWHIARWCDRFQAGVAAMTPALGERLGTSREIWSAEGLASQWGFGSGLGFGDTGMGMDEDRSVGLPLPAKAEVLAYAKATFAAAERAAAAIDDAMLGEVGRDLYERRSDVATLLVRHLGHVLRHLGMIEALRGMQGLRGTATA